MNKQRKVVITTTYNEMGIIIDTKVEEVTQPEQRWIPVAEKSPLPQTPVWTTDIDRDVSVCKLSHSGNEWYGENDGRIYLHGSVVAWMPYNAPEPYQESSFRKEVKEQE